MKNDYTIGVKNGQVGTITNLQIENSELHLTVEIDSGKRVRFSVERYPNIEHGYAITSYKSQGATVQRAHVLLGGFMQTREMSYVSLSRAKVSTQIYVNSSEVTQFSSMVEASPTPRMLSLAFSACRQWLEEQTELGHLSSREMKLVELTEMIEVMQRSRQKETTIDYLGSLELDDIADIHKIQAVLE